MQFDIFFCINCRSNIAKFLKNNKIVFKPKKLVRWVFFFNLGGEENSLKLAALEHISNSNILIMYSSNGNNANYNIQKFTYSLFKDIVILDYRKPETGSKSTTFIFYEVQLFVISNNLFFSFLYDGIFFQIMEKHQKIARWIVTTS